MHSILHKITIESTPAELFKALNTEHGLSSWWTKANLNSDEAIFYFGPNGEHQVTMKILARIPNQEIRWQCIDGPWVDNGEFIFSITEDERGACLDFAHHGWHSTDDFYKHCNPKWAFFLAVSLKQYLETGRGMPHPKDPNI